MLAMKEGTHMTLIASRAFVHSLSLEKFPPGVPKRDFPLSPKPFSLSFPLKKYKQDENDPERKPGNVSTKV